MAPKLGSKMEMTPERIAANRINCTKSYGRPKVPFWAKSGDIKRKAQKLCGEAIETVAYLMRHSTNDAIKLAAAKELMDRGIGKPTHSLETHHIGGPMLNQLVVVTGVPEPDPGPPPEEPDVIIGEEEDEDRLTIEGEVVNGQGKPN